MQIELKNLGKRYNRQWVFRTLDYFFTAGNAYAIVGPNGSGKSTFLQVLAGGVEKSEGSIRFTDETQKTIDSEHIYRHITIASPYLALIEELTLTEFFQFHFSVKSILPTFSINTILQAIALEEAANKQIRYFSSGMKQRVKLGQAIFSNTKLVILDEPTANLDVKGIALYKHLIHTYCSHRLLIIGSNDENEIDFCNYRLNIADYKNFA